MDNKYFLIEEYKFLKQEMADNKKSIITLITTNAAILGFLLSYALEIKQISEFYFLLPVLVSIPFFLIVFIQIISTKRIASYIKEKIEPLFFEDSIGWENYSSNKENFNDFLSKNSYRLYLSVITLLHIVLPILCMIYIAFCIPY